MSAKVVRRSNFNQHHKTTQLLSSLALPLQKVIAINDKIGLEPKATELVTNWLQEQRGEKVWPCAVNQLTESSEFLLLPVCRLERQFEPSQLFKFVAQCKKDASISHVFLWISAHKLQRMFVLPYLEHMADTVVTFEDNQHISLLVKKSSGSVTNKYYEFDSAEMPLTVIEAKRSIGQARPNTASVEVDPAPNPASLGTFKIDLNDEELVAKNALTLPFEFYKSTEEGGKILYHPDAEDDLDEEDPDDDLLI